ncbi:MAG: pseudouridine-5'-phosphate glycosidase [Planctomycetes bacterium]|nr:pseudouridine-5'-phosphate glycosidase [Planctomycetota bacterium]
MSELFLVSPEVAEAVAGRRPVVALETTLVTHGLPRPDGVRVAAALEETVRSRGAIPATIGILDGAVRVGMTTAELARLAAVDRPVKVNLGNLAAEVAAGGCGSTTVAATMFAAARAGILVFATGGIGGVHRGSTETGDVSADLAALARYPVAVVCSGAKAILDLPRTVELLETLGVPVLGLGTDEFPAFYRRESGLRIDRRYDWIADVARAVRTHLDLGFTTGLVIANPVPEADALPREMHDSALGTALLEAADVSGRDVTPYLLDRMRALTGGASVKTNEALLLNNARAAADVAVALADRASG